MKRKMRSALAGRFSVKRFIESKIGNCEEYDIIEIVDDKDELWKYFYAIRRIQEMSEKRVNTLSEFVKEICKFNQILYLIFDYPYKHYTFKYFEV